MDNFEEKIPYYQVDINQMNDSEILERCYEALAAGDARWGLYFCEELLRRNPQNAEAYLCRVMIENNCRNVEELADCEKPLEASANFSCAVYYATDELKATLNGYAVRVKDRIREKERQDAYNRGKALFAAATGKDAVTAAAKIFGDLGDYSDSAELLKQCEERIWRIEAGEKYAVAMQKIKSDDLSELYEAKGILEKIRGYENVDSLLESFDTIYTQKQEELQQKAELARQEEEERKQEKVRRQRRRRKIIAICAVSFVLVACLVVASIFYFIPLIRYEMAEGYIKDGNYQKAYAILSDLGDFKNSSEKIRESKYNQAKALFEKGDYAAAYALFSEIGDYSDAQSRLNDCLYEEGKELIAQKQWAKAKFNFQRLGEYKDSREYIKECTYMEAKDLGQKGKWEEAMSNYFSLVSEGGYKDSDELLKYAKYNCARVFAEAGRFIEAVDLYNQVGDEYEEAHDLKLQAMFNYVKNHQNSEDLTTYEYLVELTEEDYDTSEIIYNSLFGWRAECVINDSKTGTEDVDRISRYEYVYFHITLRGGPPDGKTTVRYVINFPNGSTERGTFTKDWREGDSGVTWVWYNNPEYGTVGNAYIKLYDSEDKLIGEDSVYITY